MIQDYVRNIASQMKIQLSRLSMVEGRSVGCLDAHLLNLTSNGHQLSTIVYQSELDIIQIGDSCGKLESRIHSALLLLQKKLKL